MNRNLCLIAILAVLLSVGTPQIALAEKIP